jgi:TolA-binding protein
VKAYVYILIKIIKTASELFFEGLKVGTDSVANGKAYYYYGECLLQLGNETSASKSFQRSYALAPDSEQGVMSLAESKRLSDNANYALNVCNKSTHGAIKVATYSLTSPDVNSWSIDAW